MPFRSIQCFKHVHVCDDQLIRPFIGHCVVVYFDDILVYNKDLEKHPQHLQEVLSILQVEKFYAAPKKCVFCTDSMLFLGYVVSSHGILVDSSKIKAMK